MSKLKEVRNSANLSRHDLAEHTGLNLRTIEAYEQKRRDINSADMKTLLKICKVLGCRLDDIVDDPELIELINAYI